MTEPAGYELEPLREGADFTLYRGRRHGNPSPLLLVALPADRPSPQGLKRLQREYSLAAELDAAWAAVPLALTRYEGRTVLVLTDPGGEFLDQILERALAEDQPPLDLSRVLGIAIGMAAALCQVHGRGLIHKDIKPENVLVDEAGNVSLTGFGIASRLPQESQAPAPPEIIAGTLAYMAPEQTGRMNRSIGTRSDLYSLGVTLYQMLTGTLPFEAADPLEWVHCHIARQPTPPGDRAAIPEPLSSLTMKLLAKNAEERYQTAAGLESDLRRCMADWQTHGRIDPFPLGAHDSSDRLLIPEKLYGREREVTALLAAFDRVVAEDTPELVLVSGYSGVGKSSVVNELHKVLVLPRGLFAAGKFDQYKRDIPYATLAQAFQTLVRQILLKPEAEVARWRQALQEAVGPNGQLIVNLIPEAELIIGKQPPVPDLSPQDSQNRFQTVFRRFLAAFARPEHPLALFLDDLQWLDAATLELLEHVITDPDVRHLMLVGAYRDNEVSSSHPLMRTLGAIRKFGVRMQEIVLAPLRLDDVDRLVADALRTEPDAALPLAQLVIEKTGGNPFFAIQFLTGLADEGLLKFDTDAAAWTWDVARIRAKGYTDNVVDLMVGKLKRLSGATQDALRQLACLGHEVEIATLTLMNGESEDEIDRKLLEAARTGLILRLESSYAFLHDRVQEAAYALIPEGERPAAHLRIGRVLASRTAPEELEDKIFDIVNQFDHGAALIDSREERERVAEFNLIAGKRAKTSTAYAAALNYLGAGRELLTDDTWDRRYELIFSLEYHRAECELLTADLDAAEERLTMLSERGRNLDIAAVARLRMTLYTTMDRSDRGVEVCLEYQRSRGVEWSPHPTQDQVRQEYERIWSQVGARSIEELVDLPLMSDPESRATLDVLTEVVTPALFTDQNLLSLVICRMANLSLEHGNSDGSCFAYVWLGMILGPHFGDYQDGFRFGGLGYDLVEKRGLHRYQARAYMSFGNLVMPWTKHVRTGRDLVRRAIDAAYSIGDLTFAAYSCNNLNTNLLAAGDLLDDVQREAESGLEFARKARFGLVIDIISTQLGLIRTLRGLTPEFGSFNDERFDENRFERHLQSEPGLALPECWYWIRKLQACVYAHDWPRAIEAASQAQQLLWTSPSFFEVAEYHFYGALARAARCDELAGDERAQHMDALAGHHRQLAVWAENCPENFANRAVLVAAEIARLQGRALDATALYEQAIESARKHGFVHNEGLAHELAGRFYLARNRETVGYAYLRNARNCYDRWGALGKVKQLDALYFPNLHEERLPASTTATIGTPVGQLDVDAVVKASQALSSEMVLDNLVEKLVRIAVEHAGAQRGLLILLRNDEPRIEAEAATGQGGIEVHVRRADITPSDLLQPALYYVIRTHERVVLDDASVGSPYSEDEYVRQKHPRSVLCLPIVKQTKLIGAFYLENNLTPCAFTSDRVAVLEVLASQAAISLENASLYSDLQRSEGFLADAQTLSHTGSFGWAVASGEIHWSEETYHIFECDRSVKPTLELVFQRTHPDDRDFLRQVIDNASGKRADFDIEFRLLMLDGRIRHIHVLARMSKSSPATLEYGGAVMDVTAAREAEEKIRQSERELRQIVDFAPQLVAVVRADPNRTRLYVNQAALDYFGLTLDEWQSLPARDFYHRDDWERMLRDTESEFSNGVPHEVEVRFLRKDRQYRWFLLRWNPLPDEHGRLRRWYVAGTDIEDRKQAEQRLQNENVALREEIAKASMFEEIVGTSAPLQEVLSRISKVAPTDSSILITGETGTGKELVARAIHRRSRRSGRAFISVNCAAIPHDLIASELFGHEKGAFTGAAQRRIGRFELAEGGTIFLDEIGELPAETQIALLRVLQEHEFDRLGGTASIRTDVRVIAATNRDLEAAIASGKFRSDLFYRLNVFPIEMPSLRQRREDIPLLVEYFIDRFARKEGKNFQTVSKKSLDLLQSYPWPGNIRELQNVIERSVIVCESENFSVDESWLSRRPSPTGQHAELGVLKKLPSQEKALIEAALRESGGQVYGPSGAAAKLGIPRSTLESKIRTLKIEKHRFKADRPLKNN